MLQYLSSALRMTVVSVILLGFLYPAAVTGAAQLAFHRRAEGSYVEHGGKTVGSELIGQLFTSARYFHGRPSAAGKDGYDPTSTGGTNLGPTSRKLIAATTAAIAAARKENPKGGADVPIDLVTSSASGIDPDISPAAARYQAARVASARRISLARVNALIDVHTAGRTLGVLGEPRVNVLALNLALDELR